MPSFSSLKFGAVLLLGLAACSNDNPLLPPVPPAPSAPLVYTVVSTLAGSGAAGYADGAASVARFSTPEGVAVDAQDNVYVADAENSSIRKITPAGVVSTLAGNGTNGLVNGTGTAARFYAPVDVALDKQNNLYVADAKNHCIRKITPAGAVSTLAGTGVAGFADGPAASAQFDTPNGIAIDDQNVIYVADYGNYRIRKITPGGVVSTLAGTGQSGFADGAGSKAQFTSPEGLTLDAQGQLYVADFVGNRIRKITPDGTVSTLAGTGVNGYVDGPGNTAQFGGITGVTIDAHGDLYASDLSNNCIRKITVLGEVSTLTGTSAGGFADGPIGTGQFKGPTGIVAGAEGVLYVTEFGERVRRISTK